MSKYKKPVLPVHKTPIIKPSGVPHVLNKLIEIPMPYLWLACVSLAVYLPCLWFGYTELDDSMFIKESGLFNADLSNLVTTFHRGVFEAVKDPYYRPLFLDSIILNYKLFGQEIAGYHAVNILFHMSAVMLLYTLFKRLNIRPLHAFILTLIFAVHPGLSQAVAWIPGRNDTILAIFVFAFFIQCIDYTVKGKVFSLVFSVLFLLLAFFTKETAVFTVPVAIIMLTVFIDSSWKSKRNLTLYATWAVCFIVWYYMRSRAEVVQNAINPALATSDFVRHLPILLQYLGKVFLPFNLSVFPTQQDTVYYYGITALILIAILIYYTKTRNTKAIAGGLSIFFIFLIPMLILPKYVSNQIFEHRLYLPITGILLFLPQTKLFKNTTDRKLLTIGIGITVMFSGINLWHQRSFADPITFWTQAAETAPSSAYANMNLAARTENVAEAAAGYRKAYEQDSTLTYLNYYIGEILQNQDSVLASEPYLLAEKRHSGYYKCNFLLARVAMVKGNIPASISCLQTYLKTDSLHVQSNFMLYTLLIQQHQIEQADEQALASIRRFKFKLQSLPADKITNSALANIYFQTHQPDKAKLQLQYMQQQGIQVPNEYLPAGVVQQINQ